MRWVKGRKENWRSLESQLNAADASALGQARSLSDCAPECCALRLLELESPKSLDPTSEASSNASSAAPSDAAFSVDSEVTFAENTERSKRRTRKRKTMLGFALRRGRDEILQLDFFFSPNFDAALLTEKLIQDFQNQLLDLVMRFSPKTDYVWVGPVSNACVGPLLKALGFKEKETFPSRQGPLSTYIMPIWSLNQKVWQRALACLPMPGGWMLLHLDREKGMLGRTELLQVGQDMSNAETFSLFYELGLCDERGHMRAARSEQPVLSVDEKELGERERYILLRCQNALKDYVSGLRRPDWPLEFLDFSQGRSFDREIWTKIQEIPFGETLTYLDLAESLQTKRASAYARAVGQAVARNPWPLIVPCHRVLGQGQKMVGFSSGGGVELKERLLSYESFRARGGTGRFEDFAKEVPRRVSSSDAKERDFSDDKF